MIGLFFLGPIVFYDLLSEYLLNGQSVGKIAMNIRVVMLDGSQPNFGAYLLRWVLRIVESGAMLFGIVPIIAVAINGKGQRLGDIAAGTTVVKLKPAVSLDDVLMQPTPENYQVMFPDVRLLTDHDISVVRDVLRRGDTWAVSQAADRIKEVTDISTTLGSRAFLHQIVADYQFITSQ
ncbi:RDD family protein [Spirosoma rhododendri]|uniref:RDD family protein n=1 Tax=Spirosoma rhododendri TaxID=2728024 RepID=UPI0020C497A9|nr:RDD family protein [Spirosoma rhododendri]